MITSLKALFSTPYNKRRPFFAFLRLLRWKWIRLFKLSNVRYRLWGNKFMYLNHDSFQSMWIMYNYIVDWEEFNLIAKLVKQGDIVADIGANMGFYSIWMSKFTCGDAAIHSFEPDEKNFQRLTKNIETNNLEKIIKANNEAAGAFEGETFFTKGLDGENHIATGQTSATVKIKITTLDSYCRLHKLNHLRYCKVDVEGFELDVLKGAAYLLSEKKIDVLQLEINATMQNSTYNATQLLAFVKEHGYSLCGYNVELNSLYPLQYDDKRENYFAVTDINAVNILLQ
jgi:FkbM family methyltransferase